jgi:hypothetical protein
MLWPIPLRTAGMVLVNRLVHRGLGVHDLSQAVGRALVRAVPSHWLCVLTNDPTTLLPTGEYVEHGLPATVASQPVARSERVEVLSVHQCRKTRRSDSVCNRVWPR